MSRGSFAEINIAALKDNLLQVVAKVGDCPILAVVKANAYGHGAVRIAQFLQQSPSRVRMFGIAFLEEGIALREAGITTPILLLTGCPIEQIPEIIQYNLSPVIFDLRSLSALNTEALKLKKRVKIHIKVDSGMGRIGITPTALLPFLEKVRSYEMISLEGIMSHFAEADLGDLSFAKKQLTLLQDAVAGLTREGITLPYLHLANSAAVLNFKPAHLGLVRPGLMLYGYSPLTVGTSTPLKPVMQVKARVLALKKVPTGTPISYGRTFVTRRESIIATVAMGYADGYPVALSNRGMMIAKGTRVPVIGRVCMDMTMLDVTEVEGLSIGDFVTVMGAEGNQSVWASQLALWANTHPYEILCGIGTRVQRRYLESHPKEKTSPTSAVSTP